MVDFDDGERLYLTAREPNVLPLELDDSDDPDEDDDWGEDDDEDEEDEEDEVAELDPEEAFRGTPEGEDDDSLE